MKLKYALMATTTAFALAAGGFAQAQESPSSRPDPAPLIPEASSPGSASGGLSTGGSANPDMSGTMSGSSSLSVSSLNEIKDDSTIVSSFNMNVKKLKGMDVIGADGKKIGDVDKVLADSSNSPKAVTVDAGGFLGIGGHEVVVPLDKLQKGASDNQLKTAMTKDQIQSLDKWEAKRDVTPRESRRDIATGAGGQPATSIPNR